MLRISLVMKAMGTFAVLTLGSLFMSLLVYTRVRETMGVKSLYVTPGDLGSVCLCRDEPAGEGRHLRPVGGEPVMAPEVSYHYSVGFDFNRGGYRFDHRRNRTAPSVYVWPDLIAVPQVSVRKHLLICAACPYVFDFVIYEVHDDRFLYRFDRSDRTYETCSRTSKRRTARVNLNVVYELPGPASSRSCSQFDLGGHT